MEVNVDESYAINGWTVDPNVSGPTPPPTAAADDRRPRSRRRPPRCRRPRPRRRPRPDDHDHDGSAVPTTTVPPVDPAGAGQRHRHCNNVTSNPQGWSQDFGPGTWAAEYWNWGGSRPSFNPSDAVRRFTDARPARWPRWPPVATACPLTGVQEDNFSARFTKTWTTTAADGSHLPRRWRRRLPSVRERHPHHQQLGRPRPSSGTPRRSRCPPAPTRIVFEFYENGGQNSLAALAQLSRLSRGAAAPRQLSWWA